MATSYSDNRHRSNAAPLAHQILHQVKCELLLTARRGENVLITLIVPVVLLIFFTSLNLVPKTGESTINFLLPGILALAIIAAGMVNLGIATAYERYYGVLKRLGSSPLPRSGLIIAKVISILILEVLQVNGRSITSRNHTGRGQCTLSRFSLDRRKPSASGSPASTTSRFRSDIACCRTNASPTGDDDQWKQFSSYTTDYPSSLGNRYPASGCTNV